MAIRYIGNKDSDGTVLGQSATDKLGFYGLATAIVKPSVTWPNTATATTTLNELKANRLMAALVALGLIVTT
jgi:branched-subunit amino acid transport protein